MPVQSADKRAYALDALRGFAMLTMVLSGVIPFGVLPRWMYHAQVPPPDHVFNPNLPGITWVDLVFPFFLFAMGAAIPLALSRRLEKGDTCWTVIKQVLLRGVLLMGFAVYIQHVRPYTMNPQPTTTTWFLALLGFALLFPVLTRLPQTWKPWVRWAVKLAGWGGVIAFMWLIRYPDGTGFSLYRSDIIIRVLAVVAVFGSLVWLATQRNNLLRLGVMGAVVALRLSSGVEGSWTAWWDASPLPWAFSWNFLKYLLITIPGTIAGDMVLQWMKSPEKKKDKPWTPVRLTAIAVLMLGLIAVVVVGLYLRLVWQTAAAGAVTLAVSWLLLRKPNNSTEKLLKDLFTWGVYWLALGLLLEPYEGGIKKDSATISYFFVTSGLAVFMLIGFTVIINLLRKRWVLGLLIDNGQNPMIAYAGEGGNFIGAVFALTGLATWLTGILNTPWLGVIYGALVTLLLALAVSAFTRLKVFWRT